MPFLSSPFRPQMASLFKTGQLSAYRDRRFHGSQEEFEKALRTSSTVYVGNLSFYTTEEQIQELFSKAGEIRRIIMGLDKYTMTPCGFCFVLYYTRADAEKAVKYINSTVLDERPIRVDFDWGFQDGRQWGRGRSGGQVRDEYRTDYDPGRGGYGKLVQRELEDMQQMGAMALMEGYAEASSPFMFAPIIPPGGVPPYLPHAGGMRNARDYSRRDRDRRPRGGPGSGGSSHNRPDSRESGGRKRGREEQEEAMQEERPARNREGRGPAREGEGSGAAEGQAPPQEGAREAAPGGSAERQKNPRFRERQEDSDEEGDK